jgi:hypothetical protein
LQISQITFDAIAAKQKDDVFLNYFIVFFNGFTVVVVESIWYWRIFLEKIVLYVIVHSFSMSYYTNLRYSNQKHSIWEMTYNLLYNFVGMETQLLSVQVL